MWYLSKFQSKGTCRFTKTLRIRYNNFEILGSNSRSEKIWKFCNRMSKRMNIINNMLLMWLLWLMRLPLSIACLRKHLTCHTIKLDHHNVSHAITYLNRMSSHFVFSHRFVKCHAIKTCHTITSTLNTFQLFKLCEIKPILLCNKFQFSFNV